MCVAITVRNVPDEVREELAARAAQSGRSLQEFLLRELIRMASNASTSEVIARARERVRATDLWLDASELATARDAERR